MARPLRPQTPPPIRRAPAQARAANEAVRMGLMATLMYVLVCLWAGWGRAAG